MRGPLLLLMCCLTEVLSGQSSEAGFTTESVFDSVVHVEGGPLRAVPPVARPDSSVPVTRRRIPVGDALWQHLECVR